MSDLDRVDRRRIGPLWDLNGGSIAVLAPIRGKKARNWAKDWVKAPKTLDRNSPFFRAFSTFIRAVSPFLRAVSP